MADFFTGKALDEKLTDIIWNAKKELIILSPFIRLDDYCKEKIFAKLINRPELEVILVFGKNEGETQRSLNNNDLEFFKEFKNIVIIYCNNLHAKYYSNENEALLTSLNLLGKSMTGNVEYGISFTTSKLTIDKLYTDSMSSTNEVIKSNPCVYVKRPMFKKTNLGLSKKYINSVILFDETHSLYNNRRFANKFYNDFDYELFENDVKPSREEFHSVNEPKGRNQNYSRNDNSDSGYCIRTGVKIPFDTSRPFSLEAYRTWATFENWEFPEKYCHKTGKFSNGKTSMANPVL
ncbi:phospholipase D family protein [Flavobacterium sp.]|uniref:phospholipase D family protein n=1 Tax=Flavobacterium sp. TaxID=239 RepID=UPI0024875862|nr:phospholipase D family protein [Flavobacterium sp.]MDI1317061.1 phospholipase D family protein [Flavobacterium sp.]